MFHFLLTGGPIPADHLSNLVAFFSKLEIPHVKEYRYPDPGQIIEGDIYISCDLGLDAALEPARGKVFQVQMSHNLTGLKGSNLSMSRAELNIIPGIQHVRSYGLGLTDDRYVIGGYPKWDSIYEERFMMDERRAGIANESGCDPDIPWVVFYPTGPNPAFSGNQHHTVHLFKRLTRDLGAVEFFFCNHAHTADDKTTQKDIKTIEQLSTENRRFHIVDGQKTLPFISACDLFITDIASSVITALSMKKPVAFMHIENRFPNRSLLQEFQCGTFIDQIHDFREYIEGYVMSESLNGLFAQCVRYDDNLNCERITGIIREKYDSWLKGE